MVSGLLLGLQVCNTNRRVNAFLCCLQVHVLQPTLLSDPKRVFIGQGGRSDGKKWSDVHKQPLHFRSTNYPARRLLALHAQLAINHAVSQQWLQPGEVAVSEAGWESPGFDKTLMHTFLVDAAKLTDTDTAGPE